MCSTRTCNVILHPWGGILRCREEQLYTFMVIATNITIAPVKHSMQAGISHSWFLSSTKSHNSGFQLNLPHRLKPSINQFITFPTINVSCVNMINRIWWGGGAGTEERQDKIGIHRWAGVSDSLVKLQEVRISLYRWWYIWLLKTLENTLWNTFHFVIEIAQFPIILFNASAESTFVSFNSSDERHSMMTVASPNLSSNYRCWELCCALFSECRSCCRSKPSVPSDICTQPLAWKCGLVVPVS